MFIKLILLSVLLLSDVYASDDDSDGHSEKVHTKPCLRQHADEASHHPTLSSAADVSSGHCGAAAPAASSDVSVAAAAARYTTDEKLKRENSQDMPLFFEVIRAYRFDETPGQQAYKPKTVDGIEKAVKKLEGSGQITQRNWFLQRAPKGGSDVLKVFRTFNAFKLTKPQKEFLDFMIFVNDNKKN